MTNRLRYTDEKGKSRVKSFRGANKTEAKRRRQEWQRKREEGYKEINNNKTLEEYLREWLVTYKRNAVTESTYDNIEDCINCRVFGYDIADIPMNMLNLDIMQEYVNKLVDKGYKRATILKTVQTLNNCFNKAVIKGDIRSNPLAGIEIPSEKKIKNKHDKIKFYPESDMKKIYNEATRLDSEGRPKYRYGYLIVLMMLTGIRVGECLGLRWEDVDIENKKIYIKHAITEVKNRGESAETIKG